MINNAPETFQVLSVIPGYTKVIVTHALSADYDVAGIAYYKTVGLGLEQLSLIPIVEGISYFRLDNVLADTSAQFAYYDELANDPSLLALGFGLNKSLVTPIDLAIPPAVTSVDVSSESVEVGFIPGEFKVNMSGTASTVYIQIKLTTDIEWTTKYIGPFSESINLGTVGDGSYNVRVRGTVLLPDNTEDIAPTWSEYGTVVNTTSAITPPDQVTNITYSAMKKTTPADTYDVKIDWSWARGTGGGVKAFKVRWRLAGGIWSTITSIATSTVIPDVVYDTAYELEIESMPFGDTPTSAVANTFKVVEPPGISDPVGMTFTDFSQDTDIKIGYRYIKAFSGTGVNRVQTFGIDALNGNMVIGAPHVDYGGIAPITVNGATGTMAINGRIITDKIYAASYEMSWIDTNDTPYFRTANKTAFGDASDGIWMGYRGAGDFAFDLGSTNSYLRYQNGEVDIHANVKITGSGALGSYYETRYKAAETVPASPTGSLIRDPVGWTTTAPATTGSEKLWQIIARINADETVLVDWSTPPIETVVGGTGVSGAGFYRWGVAGFTAWNTPDADAAVAALRGGTEVLGDVLTLYDTADVTVSETRSWDGAAWVSAALYIDGDMIATGTIIAEKIIADNAVFSSAGIDVIYNSGADETNYIMKIDFLNGEIHIK